MAAATAVLAINGATAYPAHAADANPLADIGGKLAYVNSSGSLIVLDGTSGAQRTLIRGTPNRSIWNPVWSPDGSTIAFLAYPMTNHVPREDDVYVVAADGSAAARRVTQHATFMQSIAWFPNSQVLVYGTGFNGWFSVNRVNVDGQFDQLLYPTDPQSLSSYWAPIVSPDGNLIASTQIQYGNGDQQSSSAFLSAADGSNGGTLSDIGSAIAYNAVKWLPDNSGVVFARDAQIIQAPLDGSPARVVIRARGALRGGLSISPDASQIAFTYDGGTRGVLFTDGGANGPQRLRLLVPADGTIRNIDQLSASGLSGFDWHL